MTPCFRSLVADQRGVVFLEFLIAFVPTWVFFLCAVQLALIARANLMVKHAADSAARSAAVVLPDDPNEYGGEPEMSLGRNPVIGRDIIEVLGRLGTALSNSADSRALVSAFSGRLLANLGRSRLNTIRLAAHVPLMPLAPVHVGRDTDPSLAEAVGGKRRLLRAVYYQPFALAVTFPGLQGDVAKGPEITVRVTYAYQCAVPLARRILCRSFDDLEEKEDLGGALFPPAQAFIGGRFRGLRQEATLMIHDAPYEYRPRGS